MERLENNMIGEMPGIPVGKLIKNLAINPGMSILDAKLLRTRDQERQRDSDEIKE